MYWICPKCERKVNFYKQVDLLFDENGEAEFDAKNGVYFHTIDCECGVEWIMSISDMEERKEMLN